MNELWKKSNLACLLLYATASVASAQPLQPRTVPQKPTQISRAATDSELVVKFRDDLKVRAANGNAASSVAEELGAVHALNARFGLTFKPLIQVPQETLDFVEQRDAQLSGIAGRMRSVDLR